MYNIWIFFSFYRAKRVIQTPKQYQNLCYSNFCIFSIPHLSISQLKKVQFLSPSPVANPGVAIRGCGAACGWPWSGVRVHGPQHRSDGDDECGVDGTGSWRTRRAPSVSGVWDAVVGSNDAGEWSQYGDAPDDDDDAKKINKKVLLFCVSKCMFNFFFLWSPKWFVRILSLRRIPT